MKKYDKHLSIKELALEDRPREKLYEAGAQVLTDAELLAIIIGSGSSSESAIGLAQRILKSVDGDINRLGRLSLAQFTEFKGVGKVKAVTIAAALELGRRRQSASIIAKPKIKSSQDAYDIIGPQLQDLQIEQFWIILLSRSNELIAKKKISEGGVSATVVDNKVIFKFALEYLASSIILVHNHPSGNLKASQMDMQITRKLQQAGELMSISVLDHLIIGHKSYLSFADEGLL